MRRGNTEGKKGRISHYIVVENTQEGSGIKENSASRATLWMPLPGMRQHRPPKRSRSIPARDVVDGLPGMRQHRPPKWSVEQVYPEARDVVDAAAGYAATSTAKAEQVYPEARDVVDAPHTAYI